jgi:glycerophosphoryl diester phosphodiesterase
VKVPRFEELLEELPGVRLNAEAKVREAAGGLVEIIRRHGAEERVLVAAELETSRSGVRGYPGPWGASRRQITRFWALHRLPLGRLYTPRADALQVPEEWSGLRVLTPRFVKEAHARNIPIHVWTVDDPGDMRRLLEWGVDGVQSDRPDLLAEVLCQVAGRPAPPGLAPTGDGREG